MRLAFIGLGSNLGDRLHWLTEAMRQLKRLPKSKLWRHSSVYVTEPVGERDQPDFFNAVVAVRTALSPKMLLQRLQAIEAKLGRKREKRWGPRTIDLDILAIENITIDDDPDLRVPHPLIGERKFVLIPWLEIAADFIVPRVGKSVRELYTRCCDTSGVNMFLSAQQWREQIYEAMR